MSNIYIITKKGYGFEVQIKESDLEQLQNLIDGGDRLDKIE